MKGNNINDEAVLADPISKPMPLLGTHPLKAAGLFQQFFVPLRQFPRAVARDRASAPLLRMSCRAAWSLLHVAA
jgi:hypothetical protein